MVAPNLRDYVVRVALVRNQDGSDTGFVGFPVETFLEQLRHAGIVTIQQSTPRSVVFDLSPPKGIGRGDGVKTWAIQNAERMRSFGINAVVAPIFR